MYMYHRLHCISILRTSSFSPLIQQAKSWGSGGKGRGEREEELWQNQIVQSTLLSAYMYLVDLVHDSEGAGGDALQSHQVEHGGYTPLSPTLPLGIEGLKLLRVTKLDQNLHRVLAEVILLWH